MVWREAGEYAIWVFACFLIEQDLNGLLDFVNEVKVELIKYDFVNESIKFLVTFW